MVGLHYQPGSQRTRSPWNCRHGKRRRYDRSRLWLYSLSNSVRTGATDSWRALAYWSDSRLSRNLDDLHTARHSTNYPWNKRPDWTFDGADEVDPQRNLIKGRGGAMFKEKLLIRSSRKTFIIIDPSKRVNQLGNKFPIPVEVFPDSLTYVEHELQRLGASEIVLRPAHGKDGPVFTEMGISSSTPVLTILILRSKNNSKPLPVS